MCCLIITIINVSNRFPPFTPLAFDFFHYRLDTQKSKSSETSPQPSSQFQQAHPPLRLSASDEEHLRRQQMYYQYISTFGIPVDPGSHHLLLSNPNYKQEYDRLVDEQCRTKSKGKGLSEDGCLSIFMKLIIQSQYNF